jgi:hypothetical protein
MHGSPRISSPTHWPLTQWPAGGTQSPSAVQLIGHERELPSHA